MLGRRRGHDTELPAGGRGGNKSERCYDRPVSGLRLVVLSDTHMRHEALEIPPGDVLVHCGDFCGKGTLEDVERFDAWLAQQPHRHKVVIAGNHDWPFERSPEEARELLRSAIYLQDQAATVEGWRFYGSPWQPRFFDWAFNMDRGEEAARVWARIPPETQVLVTHGPPRGVLDRTSRGNLAGCDQLLERVDQIAPRVHLFGHIHEGYGRHETGSTVFVNASNCDLRYRPVNAPQVVQLDPTR